MNLTEELSSYEITAPLSSEKMKTSREYHALAFLQFSFPERFANLRKGETPDLQDLQSGLGVEVAWGGSSENEQISGESIKYSHAKTEEERKKCVDKIRKLGGDRNEISTSYPVGNSEGDKKSIKQIYAKKLAKLQKYKRHFKRVGLAIMIDIPMFFFTDPQWGDWFSGINQSGFDFVCLIHLSGVDIFDFATGDYVKCRPEREEMDALKKLARLTAEGIIKDDDALWKELQGLSTQ